MTDQVQIGSLLVIAAAAFVVPILFALIPRSPVPAIVGEVGAGVVLGGSVLGWVTIGPWLDFLSLFGLAYLLFLAGYEIDFGLLLGGRRAGGGAASRQRRHPRRVRRRRGGLVPGPRRARVSLQARGGGLRVLRAVYRVRYSARECLAAGVLQSAQLTLTVAGVEIGRRPGVIDAPLHPVTGDGPGTPSLADREPDAVPA